MIEQTKENLQKKDETPRERQRDPRKVMKPPKEDEDKLGTPQGADMTGLALLDPLSPALQEAARITLKKIAKEFEKKAKVNPEREDLEKQQQDAFELQLLQLQAENLRRKLKKRKTAEAFEERGAALEDKEENEEPAE